MFEDYGIICLAIKKCTQIEGRKKFHKMFYLSKKAGFPIKEKFEWNRFGPYSSVLGSEINSLYNMGLLKEERPFEEYIYSLSEDGESFLSESIPKLIEIHSKEKIEGFEGFLEVLNTYTAQQLEKAASVDFLQAKGYHEEYTKSFLEFAKKYSSNDVDEGKRLLSDLNI